MKSFAFDEFPPKLFHGLIACRFLKLIAKEWLFYFIIIFVCLVFLFLGFIFPAELQLLGMI